MTLATAYVQTMCSNITLVSSVDRLSACNDAITRREPRFFTGGVLHSKLKCSNYNNVCFCTAVAYLTGVHRVQAHP
jgi:hypothetical protein